jgi:hypothetical protein
MKQTIRSFFLELVAAAFMISFVAVPAMAADTYGHEGWSGKTQSLSGRIDKSGDFVTSNGVKYRLSGNEARKVREHKGQTVEVKGTVKEQNGQRTLDVQSYSIGNAQNMRMEHSSGMNSGAGSKDRQMAPQPGAPGYK